MLPRSNCRRSALHRPSRSPLRAHRLSYFVTVEAARQNNVMMIANPLDARGGVGVLVLGDNYVFQRRPARLFVGGGKTANEIVTVSASLCLGRRLLTGAVGERNVQIVLVKIRNDQLHKMAAGVSVVEVRLCLSRWQTPRRGGLFVVGPRCVRSCHWVNIDFLIFRRGDRLSANMAALSVKRFHAFRSFAGPGMVRGERFSFSGRKRGSGNSRGQTPGEASG